MHRFEQDNYYGGYEVESFRIIGQPLRLADLLMAIKEQKQKSKVVVVAHFPYEYGLIQKYNLSKDNILDQSDEFCEFVLELLK